MKRVSKFFLFVMLGLIIAGCSTTKDESKQTDSTNKEVAQKIKVTSVGTITTLDSALYDDVYSSDNIGQIIEGLYRIDKNNEPELGIAAAEPKVSKDGKVYTFKLRDTKWSNGDPVTADDFVYAFQNVVDPTYGSQNADSMAVIKNGESIAAGNAAVDTLGVKAIDDQTLEITLEQPVAYFKKLLTGTRFLPKDSKFAKEKKKEYGTSAENVVANGPFVLSGWDGTNETWVLKKNKNYWDAKNVKLDEVQVDVIKETSTGVNLFDTDATDFTVLTDEYAKQKQSSKEYHSVSKALVGYIGFNTQREMTGNLHVRKAIAQAFNKKAFTENVLADGSTELDGLVANNFAKDPDGKEEFRDENGKLLTYDLDAAKEEWKKAKEELGKDTISLELLSADTSSAKKTVEFLQGELEENLDGLKITTKSVPIGQRLTLNRSGEFDLFFGTWTPDYADPIDFLQPYMTNGGINFGKYSNTAYDESINNVLTTLANDPEKRWEELLKAEKILIKQDVAIAPVYQGSIAYLEAANVKGIQTLPFGRSVSYRLAYVK